MTELEERQAVLAEGRTWLGTPFRDHADSKGGGVDCAMWLVRLFVDMGITPPFDPRYDEKGDWAPYPARWFLHHGEERYLAWLERFAVEIDESEAQPADIVIYKHGLCFSHAGLILDDRFMIHAYFKERAVAICERFQIELTHLPNNKPRPRKYFNAWKKRALLEPRA